MVMGIALLAISAGIEIVDGQGTIDAEIVMPRVLAKYLGPGVLGIGTGRPVGRIHVDLCRYGKFGSFLLSAGFMATTFPTSGG